MSGEKSGNEPRPDLPEPSDNKPEEMNRRFQRIRQNLSRLLEILEKAAETLQALHEGYAKLLETERALETLSAKAAGPEWDNDPLYGAAVALVASSRFVSNKFLMERLSVGFERSVKLIERMKAEGIFDLVHL